MYSVCRACAVAECDFAFARSMCDEIRPPSNTGNDTTPSYEPPKSCDNVGCGSTPTNPVVNATWKVGKRSAFAATICELADAIARCAACITGLCARSPDGLGGMPGMLAMSRSG